MNHLVMRPVINYNDVKLGDYLVSLNKKLLRLNHDNKNFTQLKISDRYIIYCVEMPDCLLVITSNSKRDSGEIPFCLKFLFFGKQELTLIKEINKRFWFFSYYKGYKISLVGYSDRECIKIQFLVYQTVERSSITISRYIEFTFDDDIRIRGVFPDNDNIYSFIRKNPTYVPNMCTISLPHRYKRPGKRGKTEERVFKKSNGEHYLVFYRTKYSTRTGCVRAIRKLLVPFKTVKLLIQQGVEFREECKV